MITNSDDRVPDVLTSLGLKVGPLRFGGSMPEGEEAKGEGFDVDFTVMSYDVGHEKPDRRIFEAAEEMLEVSMRGAADEALHIGDWRRVYVGDEYDKDVVGAVGAGWNAVLIDHGASIRKDDVQWLDDQRPSDFDTMFASIKAVGFSSLSKLAAWLPKPIS